MINIDYYFPQLSSEQKSNILKIMLVHFLMLLSYPMVRSITSSYFLDVHGASSLPQGWLASILVLIISISLINRLQIKLGVQKLFIVISVLSASLFLAAQTFQWVNSVGSFALLVWKEVYIVLLMHLMLAYTNSLVTLKQMKSLYGHLGATGSLGGIIGGLATSFMSRQLGTEFVLIVAAIIITLMGVVFVFTKNLRVDTESLIEENKKRPLESVAGIKNYVFLIASMVALTQFCINIADLQFNILFEKTVETLERRTELLGYLYSSINTFTLIVQFLILPYLLNKVRTDYLLYSVPIIYFVLNFLGLGLGGNLLWSVGLSFVCFKGIDYSLFSTTKELLYHPMSYIQKFGAKYICDMFSYRTSKSVISFVLMFVQGRLVLSFMMFVFLMLWGLSIRKIFILEKKLFTEKLT